MAPQLTGMNGWSLRALAAWIAPATSSLPTPLSPVMSTLLGIVAHRAMCARTAMIAGLSPTSAAAPRRGAGARIVDPLSLAGQRRSTRSTLRRRSSISNGLSRKSLAPSRSASTAVLTVAYAVKRITATRGLAARERSSNVQPGHADVAHDDVESPPRETAERFFRADRDGHIVAVERQQLLQRVSQTRLVVNDQDRCTHTYPPGARPKFFGPEKIP